MTFISKNVLTNLKNFLLFISDNLRRRIRSLREVIRRRNKRIRTLNDALEECQKKRLLTEEAFQDISTFHPVAQDLILNEVC